MLQELERDDTPTLGVSQSSEQVITEGFSPDDETAEILADLSAISKELTLEPTPNNQPSKTQENNPFDLISLPHIRLTEERQNTRPSDQSRGKYSGLGFQTIGKSYSGHQNSSFHK